MQTPYEVGFRKAIKPDLRICLTERIVPEDTIAIVEFKQRTQLTVWELEELVNAYSDASPRCFGVVVANYDSLQLEPTLPNNCFTITQVHPGNQVRVGDYEKALRQILAAASFQPKTYNLILLLDVSGSMVGCYDTPDFQEALRIIRRIPIVKAFTFNKGLTSQNVLRPSGSNRLVTLGDTSLVKALDDLKELGLWPDRLLVVTDGEHDYLPERTEKISAYRECMPSELRHNLQWLIAIRS